TTVPFEGAGAYHDHNWGRWYWGDEIAWDWGCLLASDGTSIVFARTTDRARRRPRGIYLLVQTPNARRMFSGPAVRLTEAGVLDAAPRRLPGALAALHAGRARPRLPAT